MEYVCVVLGMLAVERKTKRRTPVPNHAAVLFSCCLTSCLPVF